MRVLALRRVDRRPSWPLWAIGLVSLWLALIGANLLLDPLLGRQTSLCLFHTITTIPCPTCGAGRCLLALAALEPTAAFFANPLFLIVFALFAAQLTARLAFGVTWRLNLQPRTRRALLLALLVAVAANWAYLIASGA